MTFPVIFVGNMPGNHCRMLSIPFCQPLVNFRYKLPVNSGSITVIHPHPVQISGTVRAHPQNLRIFFRQPRRSCPAGGCQYNLNPIFMQVVHYFIQPSKVPDTLLRLQRRPGKDAQRYRIDMCQLHQPYVLCQNIRSRKPLLRIIICTMDKFFIHGIPLHFYFKKSETLAATSMPSMIAASLV